MPTPTDSPTGLIDVELRGPAADPEPDRERAAAAIEAVLRRHRLEADGARVRMTVSACGHGPALVQVNLRVCGAQARVQIPGPSTAMAVASAAARLDRQIRRLTTAWEPWAWPDPLRRSLGVPLPGRIARVKDFRLHAGVPCQATAAMNAMDYDVYLFTDSETGEDAIVYRAGPTGVRLARQHSMHPSAMHVTLPLTVNPRTTPTLTADYAAHRLAEAWLPFLFYTDLGTGRGHLLYRRYDGDLGLIRPAQ